MRQLDLALSQTVLRSLQAMLSSSPRLVTFVFGRAEPGGAAPRRSVLRTANFCTRCCACARAATHRISGIAIAILAFSQARGRFSLTPAHTHVRTARHVTRRLTLPYPRSAHAHGAHQCVERHRTGRLRARPWRVCCACPALEVANIRAAVRSRGHPPPGAHTSLAPTPGCVCAWADVQMRAPLGDLAAWLQGAVLCCCTMRFATVGTLLG